MYRTLPYINPSSYVYMGRSLKPDKRIFCGWQRRRRALTANNRRFYLAGQEKNTGLDMVKRQSNSKNINCRGSRGENRTLMFLNCVGEDFTEEIDDLEPTCVLGRV